MNTQGEPMDRLDELAGPHEQWCHGYAHGDCCGASDCDCGRDERRVAIAAALAEEREKARAPFLAVAEEAEQQPKGYQYVAAALIRRAAEVAE